MQKIRDQAVLFWGYDDAAVVGAGLKPPSAPAPAPAFTSEVYEQLLANPKLSGSHRASLERLHAERLAKEEVELADGEGLMRLNSFLSKTSSRVELAKAKREIDLLAGLKADVDHKDSQVGSADVAEGGGGLGPGADGDDDEFIDAMLDITEDADFEADGAVGEVLPGFLYLSGMVRSARCWTTALPTTHTTLYPRRILGQSNIRILIQSYHLSNGHLIALESDPALNTAWAHRAGMISYLHRSQRWHWSGSHSQVTLAGSSRHGSVRAERV